ncbi:unnamed protein product [Rhizophagus irregularis]|nr:unnamed protein product [Rhizophagus irregularis]
MIDIIDLIYGYCIVKNQSNSSKVYGVYLCDGSYCNCQDQSSLLCKHIHVTARILRGNFRSTLNSNTNHPNQFLCKELKDLKPIIQRIQNLPNTASRIEIKKQAEFQMKEVR